MATLYLKEQGSRLGVKAEVLVVKRRDEVLLEVPVIKVTRVVLMGRGVQISHAALVFLAEREIPIVFTTQHGQATGVTVMPVSWTVRNGPRLLAQIEMVRDPARALPMVQAVVRGKLANQAALLRAWGTEWGGAAAPALARIEAARQAALAATDADQARGQEGTGAAAYWGVWRAAFERRWGFAGRRYRPATDPINALLSFGYMLLMNEVLAAVQINGLDPSFGFFHVLEVGRASLALDLEEEFRPLLVDNLVLRLLAGREIVREDFEPDPKGSGGLFLTPAARTRFILAYEAQLDSIVAYPFLPQPHHESWHRVVALQVQQMMRVIEGHQVVYHPMPWPEASSGF